MVKLIFQRNFFSGSIAVMILIIMLLSSCGKESIKAPPRVDTVSPAPAFDINSIHDTYADVASAENYLLWGHYNLHDPSIIKAGNYYYCYSSDVAYGTTVQPGIQIRKSKELIQWQYIGRAFSVLPAMGAQFIQAKGGTPFQSLWAPFIMKVNNGYRLYYSLSSPTARLSVIGLATSTNPEGPWTEKGIVVTSLNDNSVQTNAIDPTVVTTPAGEEYMYYGSGMVYMF